MKRILAGLAMACAATLVTAAPAQAAPMDPVKALKKQYVAGHGVRISETTRIKVGGDTATSAKTTGALAFGKSGVVAADLSSKVKGGSALTPERMISVGGYTYVQGSLYDKELPEGKKWVRYSGGATGTTMNQPIDIFEPKVLKALVSKAKSFKGGTYKGALTYKELGKLYGENIKGTLGKIKLTYALGVNSKGLVTRLVTGWSLDFGVLGKTTGMTDTRYTGWGSKITIKAPAKDVWVDVKDLGEDSEVPEEIPEGGILQGDLGKFAR
ncbi:hypothetical protein [Nonomuraea basaltis]|uniref:hypothetical protein n=1 Tax=Nonomuraea basaltis TaxID=2495887 RepID=UPI00110C5707|nr:hypothetical protein [Nonomuraea basaltis]TMR98085.1 hypothetical protein EJK15_14795 [Nonomuraea basaltis]